MESPLEHCKNFGFYSEGHGESRNSYNQRLYSFSFLLQRISLPENRFKWALVDTGTQYYRPLQ